MDDGYEEVKSKVLKYKRMLDNEDKVGHALKRLAAIQMSLELLTETGIGKAVNQLRNHDSYGDEAQRIVERWKELARSHGLKQRKSRSSSSSPVREERPSKTSKKKKKHERDEDSANETNDKPKKPKPSSKSSSVEGASGSGLSFADMLAKADDAKISKPKKMKLDPIDWKSSEIDMNYRPSKRLNFDPTPLVKDHQAGASESSLLDINMFRPRKDARKIYAGRPKGGYRGGVPSLQELCQRILITNIELIDEVGNAPYVLLKPVLEKCTPEQLHHIERLNPGLMDDTDELWERFVNRSFPKCVSDDDESWRECFARLRAEEERKLKRVSERINQHNRESAAPVRKALLADAKAPRDVRKRQIRYGTGHLNRSLPTASEVSKARKEIFERGNKDALANLPQAIRNTTSTLGSHSEKKKGPAKKGALMLKTLKMLKGKTRR